jgi:hypothetical protein
VIEPISATRNIEGSTKTLEDVLSFVTCDDVASKSGLLLAVTNLAVDPVALKMCPGIVS